MTDVRAEDAVVRVLGVTKSFGGATALRGASVTFFPGEVHARILDGFDIDVRRGESVAVLGPAGDAQSRLFDLLSGRRRGQSGTVDTAGAPIRSSRIAYSRASVLRCVSGGRTAGSRQRSPTRRR